MLTVAVIGCGDIEAVEKSAKHQRFEDIYYQNINNTELTIIKDTKTGQQYILVIYTTYKGGGVSITPLIEEGKCE